MHIKRAFGWLAICCGAAALGCAGEVPSEGLRNEDTDDAVEVGQGTGALTGETCEAAIVDDRRACTRLWFSECSGTSGGCSAYAKKKCPIGKATTGCDRGYVQVFRTRGGRYTPQHRETMVPEGGGEGGVIEGVFRFAKTPQPGADPRPLWRCFTQADNPKSGDFPSFSRNCEGHGERAAFHGYVHTPGRPGTSLTYRCRIGADHFMSRDPNCEGQIVEGALGWVD